MRVLQIRYRSDSSCQPWFVLDLVDRVHEDTCWIGRYTPPSAAPTGPGSVKPDLDCVLAATSSDLKGSCGRLVPVDLDAMGSVDSALDSASTERPAAGSAAHDVGW